MIMHELEKPSENPPAQEQRLISRPAKVSSAPGRPFLPGVSGNPGGRKPGSGLVSEIRKALKPAAKKTIVSKLIALAAEGNLKAIEILMDRLDGKAVQALDLTFGERPNPGEDAEAFYGRLKLAAAGIVKRYFEAFDPEQTETMRVIIEDSEETINTN